MKSFWPILRLLLAAALPGLSLADPPITPPPDQPSLPAQILRETEAALREGIRQISPNASSEPTASRLFTAACRRAPARDLDLLRDLLLSLMERKTSDQNALAAYAAARMRQAIAQAGAAVPPLKMPPPRIPLPDSVRGDDELRTAWIAWHTAIDPYDAMLDAANAANRAAPLKEPGPLDPVLRQVVADPKPDQVPLFAQQLQGAQLRLAVRDTIVFPCSRALLLITTPGRLTPESPGAALNLALPRLGPDPTQPLGETRDSVCALLGACGLDWEQVFAGGMIADGIPVGRVRRIPAVFDDMNSWQALAARGSPHGVHLGVVIIRRGKIDNVRAMDFVRTALRTTPSAPDAQGARIANSRPLPYRLNPLPPESREEVLAVVRDFLALERPPEELAQNLRLLSPELYPLLAEPLRKLLHHPSHPIAAQTLGLLRGAKLADATTEITPPPPPLRIQVLVDGTPLPNTTLQVRMNSNAMALTSDGEGWISVSLANELDPSKLSSIILSTQNSDVTIKDGEWPGPWLELTVPVNPNSSEAIKAEAATTSLEVDLDPASNIDLKKPGKIILFRTRESSGRSAEALEFPLVDSLTFRRLQRGTFHVSVFAEGAAAYESKPIVLGKNGSIRLVRLEPGRNVRAKIDSGDSITHLFRCRLFHNGVALNIRPNDDYSGWDGLPLGKYQLKLEPWGKGLGAAFGAAGIPENGYDGFTHEFEIKADSPPVIDLGKFTLKAAP